MSDLLTLTEMARKAGVSRRRAEYFLTTRRIEPVSRVGITRLFDQAAAERVRELARTVDATKESARTIAAAHAEQSPPPVSGSE